MSRSLPLLSDDEVISGPSSPRGTAAPESQTDDEAGFGALHTARGHLPLEAMEVRGRIDGLLARVTVRQTFVNALDEPIEASYIFPLPDRAAVTRFRMEVSGRVIEGILEERGRAREQYDRAIEEGRRAAIAEEDRPGVFNLRVGNLMPGERARIELTLCGVLPYADGQATFRFPLVVAPRYIPGIPLPGPSVGDGTALDTDAVPDASRISPPVLLPGFPGPVRLSLELELNDGAAELDDVRSSLHAVEDEPRDGYRRIRLYPGERLNRDFILRFRLGGGAIRSTLTLHPDPADGHEGTFALTVVPPLDSADSPARPRDVVFVLDRSGSMGGWKIVAARRALARMIDTLNDSDRFGVLAFDNVVETPPRLPAGLSAATDRHRFRAVEYLATVGARGGTEMAEPLDRAVTLLGRSDGDGRDRVLVLITDGQVGNEDQVLRTLGKRLQGIRVFTLGIDRAVNEAFLRRLAERGGGSCEVVESEDRLDEVMTAVHRRIGTPLLTGLSLSPDEPAIEPGEIVPRRLPDLFAGSPLLILGRYHGRPAGALTIRAADAAGRPWSESVPAAVRENPAIAAAWARGQVRQLEDKYAAGDGNPAALEKAIVALSLKFQVLCRFTAYVAVDRSQVVNEGGAPHRITQPVEQPEGWAAPQVRSAAGVLYCLAGPPAGMVGCASAPMAAAPPPRAGRGGFDRVTRAGGMVFRMARRVAPKSSGEFPPAPVGHRVDDTSGMAPAERELSELDDSVESHLANFEASPPSPPADLPDRFEVRDRLGAGGMGQVFKAFDRQRGQDVAVKVMPAGGLDSDALARLRRVMGILSGLTHPALVTILDAGISDSLPWIVTPLVEGRTLSERLRSSGRMEPRAAAALVAELAEALEQVHHAGLFHGALKSSDVLLGDDGRPRLTGLAEASLADLAAGQQPCSIGNPTHLAPELIRGDGNAQDPRVDVYGLGLVLYEVLTNQRPFGTGPIVKRLDQILQGTIKPPRRLVRSIPAALEVICLKAMAKDPSGRYQTAGELAAALRAFLTPAPRKGFWK
jgi:Ca-activated chloride channel family protein